MAKRKWDGKGGRKGGGRGKGKGKGREKGKEKGKDKGRGGEKKLRRAGPMPSRAVLVTSHTPSLCQKATREAIRLLDSALGEGEERLDEPLDGERRSVGQSLDAELEALKAQPRRKRLRFHSEVSRGVALLAYEPQQPLPSETVQKIFGLRKEANCPGARFVVRLAPLDFVCSPHLKSFQAAAAATLPNQFASARPGAGWYMAFHSRAMGTIKRDEAMQALKDILRPLDLDLSVSDAEYTVLVEVNPVLCGFSVLQGYEHELFECHLQKAFEDCEIQAASQDEGDDEDDDGSEDEEECEDAEATQEPAAEAEAIRKPGEAKDAQKPAAEAEAIREPSGDSGADVS
ncbi:unnamed protein product [Effrenium voratum]|nr:unnamed protein product [Effrenium voratum]